MDNNKVINTTISGVTFASANPRYILRNVVLNVADTKRPNTIKCTFFDKNTNSDFVDFVKMDTLECEMNNNLRLVVVNNPPELEPGILLHCDFGTGLKGVYRYLKEMNNGFAVCWAAGRNAHTALSENDIEIYTRFKPYDESNVAPKPKVKQFISIAEMCNRYQLVNEKATNYWLVGLGLQEKLVVSSTFSPSPHVSEEYYKFKRGVGILWDAEFIDLLRTSAGKR